MKIMTGEAIVQKIMEYNSHQDSSSIYLLILLLTLTHAPIATIVMLLQMHCNVVIIQSEFQHKTVTNMPNQSSF